MVALARRNGLVWDAILGAEVARDYKPKPVVYLAAAAAFDLEPAQTMMVAAHAATSLPRRRPVCALLSLPARTSLDAAKGKRSRNSRSISRCPVCWSWPGR